MRNHAWSYIILLISLQPVYRKYYGTRMMLFILATFYATMVVAGYAVEIIFGATGLVPATRNAKVLNATVSWDYTTILNIIFLALAAVLVWRFFATGGRPMLKMMGGQPADEAPRPENPPARAPPVSPPKGRPGRPPAVTERITKCLPPREHQGPSPPLSRWPPPASSPPAA